MTAATTLLTYVFKNFVSNNFGIVKTFYLKGFWGFGTYTRTEMTAYGAGIAAFIGIEHGFRVFFSL